MVTPPSGQELDKVYCYHYNATGGTVAVTDENQDMVNKYAYDPFGNMSGQCVEAVPQPFKYVGQFGVMAEANGFYYMRARYYDPKVGRFISEDPSGFGGGDVNLMAYVGGNPVNGIDPSGLCYSTSATVFGNDQAGIINGEANVEKDSDNWEYSSSVKASVASTQGSTKIGDATLSGQASAFVAEGTFSVDKSGFEAGGLFAIVDKSATLKWGGYSLTIHVTLGSAGIEAAITNGRAKVGLHDIGGISVDFKW